MHRICSSLQQHGYQVALVGRIMNDSKPLRDLPYAQKRLRCFFNKGKLFYAEYNIRLFFYLLFTSSNALCSIDLDTLAPGFLVSKLKGWKLVYDAHEYFTQVPEVIHRPHIQAFWEWLEVLLVPRIKNAYTVNKSIAALFEGKYKTHFDVIYNAPRLDETPLENNFSKRILLYQGALNASRGLEQLINIMPKLDAVLWLIGEGDLSEMLRKKVTEANLEEKVLFKGMISPSELANFTRQATLGINVSENAGLSYYYSLNNKFFDYIHAALPSIINDFPEYKAMNKSLNVGVLTNCDEESMLNAINKLLNDEVLYQNLKQNCVIAANIYCWQKEERKLLEFYARLR